MIISTKRGTPQVELDRIVDNFETIRSDCPRHI